MKPAPPPLSTQVRTHPSSSRFLILKSMPMVVMKVGEKESLAYRSSRHVFPTPLVVVTYVK